MFLFFAVNIIFEGLIFGPRIFLGHVGSPKDFFWVLIFAPIQSSLLLEILSTLPGPFVGPCQVTLPMGGRTTCQKWKEHDEITI